MVGPNVMNIAESVPTEKGGLQKKQLTQGWFHHFCERNSQLCLRKGDSTANVRIDAMNNSEALQ